MSGSVLAGRRDWKPSVGATWWGLEIREVFLGIFGGWADAVGEVRAPRMLIMESRVSTASGEPENPDDPHFHFSKIRKIRIFIRRQKFFKTNEK